VTTPEESPSQGRGARGRRSTGSRRARRPTPGTRPAETVGGELERRVARLEFAEGSFVRLRVPVPADQAESGRDVLTDIDVLSIDVDLRLRVSRSSLECKSGTGQSGEPMTLIWLAGFKQLLKLNRVVFVRPTVSSRGRSLARKLGIALLDESTIAVREDAHRWLPDRFAHMDGERCHAAESRTDTQLKGLPDIPASLTQFLRGDAPLASPPALLAAVESLGAAAERQGVLPEPTATVLGSHALIAVVFAAVQDASRLDEMSQKALRDRLQRALTTGDPDDEHLLPLLERADALVRHVVDRTHRAYVEAGADPIRIDMPSLRATVAAPPAYLDDYLDLVTRLRANPVIARDLLQTAELACFEALLDSKAWQSPAFAHLFTTEHKGLLLVALRCLQRIAGPRVADPLEALKALAFLHGGSGVPDRRSAAPKEPDSSSGPATGYPGQPVQHPANGQDPGSPRTDPEASALAAESYPQTPQGQRPPSRQQALMLPLAE
jgi:hypothetical protein